MARTVLTIKSTFQGRDLVELAEGVAPHPLEGVPPLELTLTPQSPDLVALRADGQGADLTGTVGQALFNALAAHPELAAELRDASLRKLPILFDDRSLSAQGLPWEAICDEHGTFLALKDGSKLGRVVLPGSGASPESRTLDQPLRMMVVLAVAADSPGDSSLPEWRALRKSLAAAGALDYRVHVLGADDSVSKAVADAKDPRVTFQFLVSAESLLDAVEDFQPHVLHLSCHGFHLPKPRLELATRAHQLTLDEKDKLIFEQADFQKILDRATDIWLVVLSSCLSATATTESRALARQLVVEGFPAVVGMQEPVDRTDANLFAESLYRSLLRCLRKGVEKGPPFVIDWLDLLTEARQRLCKQHVASLENAKATKRWTLPVLYVQRETSEVTTVLEAPDLAQATHLQSKLEELQELRSELAAQPGFPPEALAAIDAKIAALAEELAGLGGG